MVDNISQDFDRKINIMFYDLLTGCRNNTKIKDKNVCYLHNEKMDYREPTIVYFIEWESSEDVLGYENLILYGTAHVILYGPSDPQLIKIADVLKGELEKYNGDYFRDIQMISSELAYDDNLDLDCRILLFTVTVENPA